MFIYSALVRSKPLTHKHSMKNIFALGLLMAACFVSAQNTKINWTVTPESQKVFIENKGQWSGRNNLPESRVLFATDYGSTQILFTKNGLTFRLEKREMKEQDKEEEMERLKDKEKLSHREWEELKSKEKLQNEIDFVQMQWEGANPNAEVVALYSVTQYFNYNLGKGKSIEHANGYTKLLYKNLYRNIDVEYVFHPTEGIKYNIIAAKGADITQVKLKYTGQKSIKLLDGEIHIKTILEISKKLKEKGSKMKLYHMRHRLSGQSRIVP